jgi:hypothetical protein
LSSVRALRAQKPESRIMYFPVPKYNFNMHSNKPAVLPYLENSGAPNSRGLSFLQPFPLRTWYLILRNM